MMGKLFVEMFLKVFYPLISLACTPHIPHEKGIETMAEYLETREGKTVSTKSLCDLASIVLKEHYFELSSKF